MRVRSATTVSDLIPTLGAVCKRSAVKVLDGGRINLREDSNHILLEVDTRDLDSERLYVWIKQRYVLLLGHRKVSRQHAATESFVKTIQLPKGVDGQRSVVEKGGDSLRILAPKISV